MYDVECPYCGAEQEINHDDGYGYEEDEVYQQECSECEKVFVYTTSISFYYEVGQAPCQNGGEHEWKDVVGYPKEFFVGKQRCDICDEQRTIIPEDKEAVNGVL